MYLRLTALILITTLLQSCFDAAPNDKYMCGFTLYMKQEDWNDRHSKFFNGHTAGAMRVFSASSRPSEPTLGRIAIGTDSTFAWLTLNDDTVSNGSLRRIEIVFTDQINRSVYDYLCSLYGNPSSHEFSFGHPLLQRSANTGKDTASHVWIWKTLKMTVQHCFNVFPPDSNGRASYIEYKASSYDSLRERDRQEAISEMRAWDAVDVKLRLKYPNIKSPSVEILCDEIHNKDLSSKRYITAIKGDVRFYVPLSDIELTFPQISIVPVRPVPYFSTYRFDMAIVAYHIPDLEQLRPQYQNAIKDMSKSEKVESSFTVHEVMYSDGTILKAK